ncbi:hypothetical protein [Actinacidiphila glaucinigra]|uniref:Uncharacterized protein n=1 Tax=Actinacidiphila glaucinigra TaxID=235986 RepID=A0A239NUJ5_9ACTN|nr:hypothetical protein [Actinacidiphila glaucinigra]SNT58591.1 hypothetical protein SAMN05216252_15018 [Actinacidiphila glaucinigra]
MARDTVREAVPAAHGFLLTERVGAVQISTRVERRIRRDFPERGAAPEIMLMLDELPETADYDPEVFGSERLQAAIGLLARGSVHRFREAVRLARTDWRDLLVAAALAHEDWPEALDAELGP